MGPKRKRPDRGYSQDGNDNYSSNRPSPHRPQNLGLANTQQHQNAQRGRRDSRAGGRGGRGGSSTPQSPAAVQPSPTLMSPPAAIPPSHNAHSTAPAPAAPAPQTNPPAEAPSPPTVSDINWCLTQERVDEWLTSGRRAVIDAAVGAHTDSMGALCSAYDELVNACLDKVLPASYLGTAVKDIILELNQLHLDPTMCEPTSLFLSSVTTGTEFANLPVTTIRETLAPMLLATGIDYERMRAELESKLLAALELVRPSFSKIAIRMATQQLYRQSNYNLLREETEGFAKLMTEYFTASQAGPPNLQLVTATFERVTALIGAFNIDVGRALDVTLDVFGTLLVKRTEFFIKLLRISSWWPELAALPGITWDEPAVPTLPVWAAPDHESYLCTDQEKRMQLANRQTRDQDFWLRVAQLNSQDPAGVAGIEAFFEIGQRCVTNDKTALERILHEDAMKPIEPGKKDQGPSDFELIRKWSREWMSATSTVPPSGNRIAAQLLGFKLRFYASDARNESDVLPDHLIYLAALLIKIGFISLVDLYPHLYPMDEKMDAHLDKIIAINKDKEDKARGISTNALAMAGALPDEIPGHSNPAPRARDSDSKSSSKLDSERDDPSRSQESSSAELPEPADQKVALLRSLLLIGAIPEALFIISRHRKLLIAYPDLHQYFFRVFHHALDKVYSHVNPISNGEFTVVPKQAPAGAPGTQQPSRNSDCPPRKTLRWAKLEARNEDGKDYKFYWEDWVDNIPVCQTYDDVILLQSSLMGFIGAEIGKDSLLLTKLTRIAHRSLADDSSANNRQRWIDFCTTALLPALTFVGTDSAVVNEVWDLIKEFDEETRFGMYEIWYKPRSQVMRAKFKIVEKEADRLTGRMATTNIPEMARSFAKLATACPGKVFEKVLKDVITKPNLIDVLVECSKYLTYLAYDVLNWRLIKSIQEREGDSGRAALQEDGMLISPWLKNVATFVGKIYKRHKLMDSTPMIKFLGYQLMSSVKNAKTVQDAQAKLTITAVLEQLITSMGGIGLGSSLTESQVLGISAGPLLRNFTYEHYLGEYRSKSEGSSKRLVKTLKEVGLTPQILLALAIQLGTYLDREEKNGESVPIKVLATNLDNLYANFSQFLDFLRSNLTTAEFDVDMEIPSVVELMSDFSVDADVAFTISRNSLAATINAARLAMRSSSEGAKSESATPPPLAPRSTQTNGDIPMVEDKGVPAVNGIISDGTQKQEPDTSDDVEMKEAVTSEDVEMKDATITKPNPSNSSSPTKQPLNAAIEELAERLRAQGPAKFRDHLCLNFFITFWQLSLPDLFKDTKGADEYVAASKICGDKAKTLFAPRHTRDSLATRKNVSDTIERQSKLLQEMHEMTAASTRTRDFLKKEMHGWFDGIPMTGEETNKLHEAILQDCILPRARSSQQDAQFTAVMLKFMHSSGVPGFRTLKLLDLLLRLDRLANIIKMCTTRESQNLGRFLNDVLKELKMWQSSEANYARFAVGGEKRLPGFGSAFNDDRTAKGHLAYELYRKLLAKWHAQLFRAIDTCLASGEYMAMRNTVNVLKAIAPTFPAIDSHGTGVRDRLQSISQIDPREDLKLAALSLLGDIKKGQRRWVTNASFTGVIPSVQSTQTNAVNGTSSAMAQPSSSSTPKLNVDAPAFSSSNDAPKSSKTNTADHEDGEVNEERKKAAAVTPTVTSAAPNQEPARSSSAAPERTSGPNSQHDSKPSSAAPAVQTARTTPMLTRPDSRGAATTPTPSNRASHALPNRPEAVPPPRSRPLDRPPERTADYPPHGRSDLRTHPATDYGRLERPGDTLREPLPPRREHSPGRRSRIRTPERGMGPADHRDPAWGGRDPRDYHDERSMRPPPRDARGPPARGPSWAEPSRDSRDMRDMRDPRDPRDPRERSDHRSAPSMNPTDPRSRPITEPSRPSDDHGAYRRDGPPKPGMSSDRASNVGPRPTPDRPSTGATPTPLDRPAPVDRTLMNPQRAALLNDADRSGNSRRERDSRPQSPRRGSERPPAPHHSRPEAGRDDRGPERVPHGRTPPHPSSSTRDRHEEPIGSAPTGPRGPRNDAPASSRGSREMFQPPHLSRPSAYQTQDPNYGRLNRPTENAPSGPRGKTINSRFMENLSAHLLQGHRDTQAPSSAPSAPAAQSTAAQPTPAGVHPSRLNNINAPPIQTNVSGAPSGPRNGPRTPQGLAPSPTTRGPPTGPASATERNPRGQVRGVGAAITSILTQNVPVAPGGASNVGNAGHIIRGRGANRASGHMEASNVSSPIISQSHPSTPNPPHLEDQHSRSRGDHISGRAENTTQDDGRPDPRGHTRRAARSGRDRSKSPARSDRRAEERNIRNGPESSSRNDSRHDDPEKNNDRERGSGREKRGSDRDGRRERDRDSERSTRDGRDRRERSGRDEGRTPRSDDAGSRRAPPQPPAGELPAFPTDSRVEARSSDSRGRGGRDERDRRSTRDDGRDSRENRKRGRPTDELPPGDPKRARRSLQ
ncbi:transcription factor/nuclear export subunit protein 2-domain-containing protein [Lophiotrema nucula]|uniref:THO complex subunit 2 n=1 Tax=Lophiotrema nucula TaxID=690887 RepID=A0A6A5Z5R3_9PLEO|nr:transcription factor/nuclear export subunit protein 2-domain-containing protein [Lophiotrema nucula]